MPSRKRSSTEVSSSQVAIGSLKNYKSWSNKCAALEIEDWYVKYEVDKSEFRATLEILRSRKHKVALLMSHFEACLFLRINPFIAQFFNFCKAVPLDRTYNTVVILVSFATICRSLFFEPFAFLLSHFFRFSVGYKGETRLFGRGVGGDVPSLLKPFPNKKSGWDLKCIVVASIHG